MYPSIPLHSPLEIKNKKMKGKIGAYLLKEKKHFYQNASRSGKTDLSSFVIMG